MIPVLSFLWQKGKCCHCGSKISRQYPAVELLAGVLALAVYFKTGVSFWWLFYFSALGALLLIALYDLRAKIIDRHFLYIFGVFAFISFLSRNNFWSDLASSFFIALFFITIISYCAIRLLEIRSKEKKHLKHEIEEYAHHQAEHAKKLRASQEVSKNPQWTKTLGYLFSQHESDWKLAIIEADTMLESLVTQLGFKGNSLGDKLKGATQESFRNLTTAWEVHTVRNKIAHEGASFELTQREAKRVIALYEQIFREFGYI